MAFSAQKDLLTALLEQGANPSLPVSEGDDKGKTPLLMAEGYPVIVDVLKRFGAR